MKRLILSLGLLCYASAFLFAQREKSITLPGGETIEFVYIPAGSFLMGSDSGDVFYQKDEFPAHPVEISRPFWLGKYEVTQGQWEALMDTNPSVFQRFSNYRDYPVEMVSWHDCQAYIAKLNALGPGRFRLPTEAEWEYAARAGTTTLFPWGDDLAARPLNANAWFNSRAEGLSHPVGEKLPNPWGLYDMFGNVWEWCEDWYGPYPAEAQTDPQGPATGERKVFRGGSWFNEPEALRSANRLHHPPETKGPNEGFRLLLEVEE